MALVQKRWKILDMILVGCGVQTQTKCPERSVLSGRCEGVVGFERGWRWLKALGRLSLSGVRLEAPEFVQQLRGLVWVGLAEDRTGERYLEKIEYETQL